MIKNIVFDIGNVLVSFGWEPFYHSFDMPKDVFEKVANATVRDPLWNEIDRGAMSEEEILNAFIQNDPSVEAWIRKVYKDFKGMLVIFSYTREWIADLQKRGYKVYCLSNMSHKAVRECWDALSFIEMLDGYVLSCDYHLCKPEPEIYETLFSKFNLIPEECVFFDDLERNIEAAKKMGMHGIVFLNKEQAEADLKKLQETIE